MGRNCQGTKGTPRRPSKNQALGRFLWYLSISRWFPLEMTGDSTQPPINNAVVTIKRREGRGWRREPRCFDSLSSHAHTHIFPLNPGALRAHTHAGQALAWIRGGEMRSRMVQLGNAKGLTSGWQWDDGVHQAVGAPPFHPPAPPPPPPSAQRKLKSCVARVREGRRRWFRAWHRGMGTRCIGVNYWIMRNNLLCSC